MVNSCAIQQKRLFDCALDAARHLNAGFQIKMWGGMQANEKPVLIDLRKDVLISDDRQDAITELLLYMSGGSLTVQILKLGIAVQSNCDTGGILT